MLLAVTCTCTQYVRSQDRTVVLEYNVLLLTNTVHSTYYRIVVIHMCHVVYR